MRKTSTYTNFYVGEFTSLCLSELSLNSINYFKMNRINEADETLRSICAETQGCFEADPESDGPLGTCGYARLIHLGYKSQLLASADGTDGESLNTLHHAANQTVAQDNRIDKMCPECLK